MPDRRATARAAPRTSPLLAEVRDGLSARPRTLSSRFFYDHRGSLLFEQITRLPEYYLTRAETRLLERHMPAQLAELLPESLVELGAGGGGKTRIILDAAHAHGAVPTWVPIDVSAEFLAESAAAMRATYDWLAVRPIVADFTEASLNLGHRAPRPALFAFLGSTIGNFDTPDAVALLGRVRAAMHLGDRLLLGVDLRKDPAVIERAYNDSAGVTAEFNRNLLVVLNRELGANFRPERFEHHAPWVSDHSRIEMHLVSRAAQVVHIPGIDDVHFEKGDSIRTEICCKYDRASVEAMFASAGLRLDCWLEDERDGYAIVLAAPFVSAREG